MPRQFSLGIGFLREDNLYLLRGLKETFETNHKEFENRKFEDKGRIEM